ncbi:MAG: OmcA/MtrC family decaheme c-type cytochrome [Candidatus Binatia bacterium]|jgi:OmcA/MtrC family decaheme c-type cytochrome
MKRSSKDGSALRNSALLFAAVLWFGCGGGGGGPAAAPPTATPTATVVLPTSTPASVPAGPGVSSSITDATIDPSGTITVTFTVTDEAGVPLTAVLSSAQNDQQARVRLTIAHVEDYSGGGELGRMFTRYVNEINAVHPAFDSNGTLQTLDAANGVYLYTFGAHLAPGFDPTLTYSIGMEVDRTVNGVESGANPVFDLVPQPAPGATPEILESTTTAQCNSCHDPLIAHSNRREVRLCMLCHTEAATDNPPPPEPAHSIDFRHMIHKIHDGQDLPSIVNGPAGTDTTYAIYSSFLKADVVFAEKDPTGKITGVAFPQAIRECAVCHSEGPTAQYFEQRPAAAVCASCHDDVNPSLVTTSAGPSGTNHVGGLGYADGDCAFCHIPDSGNEFDISVVGAHVVPERSKQLQGLNVNITALTNHNAGQTPTILFTVTDNAGNSFGAADVAALNRLAFAIDGPTTEYTADTAAELSPTAVGGGASGTLTGPDANGVFSYTPKLSIPAAASGTWAIGAEARRAVQLPPSQEYASILPTQTAEEAAPNPVVTFTVDNSTALPHRIVVDNQHCAACHGQFSKDFSIHGNLRNNIEYCEICHNPNLTDGSLRKLDPAAVASGEQTAMLDFKRMIHKIHTGNDLEQKPYVIYGFGAPYSIIDFSNLLFPGDRRDCAKCHVTVPEPTYLMPPYPGTAIGSIVTHLDPATGNEVIDGRLGPIQSVCTACHDGDDAVAHAETMTAPDGTEACTVCHQEGAAFAVSLEHAGRN